MKASILGKRLLLLRRDKKLTQLALSEKVGLARNTIARLERGELQALRSDAVVRLARALETTTDYLLGVDMQDNEADHGN